MTTPILTTTIAKTANMAAPPIAASLFVKMAPINKKKAITTEMNGKICEISAFFEWLRTSSSFDKK